MLFEEILSDTQTEHPKKNRVGGKPRVAVVEDDRAIASLLREILTLEGFDVTVMHEGSPALMQLRAESFDVVVLDVMLPGRDGVSILRELRGNERTRETPVIMLTAKTDGRSTWEGWRAGCNLYLEKPFDPNHVVSAIRQLVAG